MRALLLNPPGPYCRAGSRWPHRRKPRAVGIDYHPFPFAPAYATSRLLADGHEARLLDCIALGMDDEGLSAFAASFGPDIAIMETSAPSFLADAETMRRLRIPCIAAGAHATATWRAHLDAGFAAVILGEYDQVASQAVAGGSHPWLATPEHEPTEHAPLALDLDAIPPPPWEQMAMERYNDPFCYGRSVTVLTSRGCPHRCGFCTLMPYQGQRSYRRRSAAAVCDEIAALIARYRPDEIYFDDDTITANRGHILELCAELRRRAFGVPFSCMGNAPTPTEVLEAMARAGCRAFKFGVESTDPAVLERIPKPMEPADVARTVADCRRLGIRTHATFLFGLPGETRESALRTIDFALGLGAHTLQFAIVTPYPGTPLYDEARREGWLLDDDWTRYDPAGDAVLSYPGYSAEDIRAVHDLAWRRWQWHMLTRQPATLWHHFRNAYRREGLGGALRLGRYGASRLMRIWGSSRD